MANVRNGNTWYVDTSSASTSSASFISEKNLKLIGVIYHVATANTDAIELFDKNSTDNAAGVKKLTIKAAVATSTQQLRLESTPIVFSNGVWVTLTGAPIATLIFTTQGNV